MKALLERGAVPRIQAPDVVPILVAAISYQFKPLIRRLLKASCDSYVRSEDGETPMFLDAAMDMNSIMGPLSDNGTNPNLAIKFGRTLPMVASARGRKKWIQTPFEIKGLEKNAFKALGQTALSEAHVMGSSFVKKVLLDGCTDLQALKALDAQAHISSFELDGRSKAYEDACIFCHCDNHARLAAIRESEYRQFCRKRGEVFHKQDDVAPEEVIIALREIMASAFTEVSS